MKRSTLNGISHIPAMIAIFLFTSCIYDAPGDEFYRTLWTSDTSLSDTSLSDTSLSEALVPDDLLLDFLCNGQVYAQSTSAPAGDYGTYRSNKSEATLQDLSLTLHQGTIIFTHAQRSGDTLLLTYQFISTYSTSAPQTIKMHRLSAYPKSK